MVKAKVKRSFRIDEELNTALKNFAESQGITVSQLIELACYDIMSEKKINVKNQKLNTSDKKIHQVSIYLPSDTYRKLLNIVNEKNSSVSQEINFRLDASLGIKCFSDLEIDDLFAINRNVTKLGNLLKLSLNNNLNTPELLLDIHENITELRKELRELRERSTKRVI